MDKLKSYSFAQSGLKWINSYLSSRTQQVFFNGILSNSISTTCGLPQGSCSGTVLFSIFINGFLRAVKKARIVMYANNATLVSSSSTISALNRNLQDELNMVVQWVATYKLVRNTTKRNVLYSVIRMSNQIPFIYLVT